MNFTDSTQETTAGTSTATIILNGATAGNRTFATGLTVGMKQIPIRVADDGGNWLIGEYTLTNATTLTRTRIAASSAGGSNVTLAGAVRKVSCVPIADQFIIGMVNPDDVGFDIILIAGQSNAVGRGTIDTVLDTGDPRVFQFGTTTGQARYRNIFPATEPMQTADGFTPNQVGPSIAFAKSYLRGRPANRMVLLVPCAIGGTALVPSPAHWAVGNVWYNNAIAQVNAAITAAIAAYPTSRFAGIYWCQGEQDSVAGATKAPHVTALKATIAGFRANITGAANSFFMIAGMTPGFIATYAEAQIIRDAHVQVATETDRCWYVAGRAGYDDALHYNGVGLRYIGTDCGLAVPSAQRYLAVSAPATAVTLSGPTTGLIGTASTNFTVNISGVITGTVRVTPNDGAQGGSFTPAFLDLTNATSSGVFAYTAASGGAKTITAANNGGLTAGAAVITIAAAASALVLSVPASSGAQGVPVVVTFGTNNPLTGAQSESIVPSSNVAGTWSVNPVVLNAGTATGTSTFTPSATGVATLTGTPTGTPTLPAATTSYTVTAVDSVAPILSSPTGAQTGPTTANGTVATDEANGTLYALCSVNAVETAATTKASPNTQAITSTGTKNVAATGLTTGVMYYWHYLHRDNAGNDSGVSHSAGFTPIAVASSTMNPADKNAAVTLSNGNLTASGPLANTSNWDTVRSTSSKSGGQSYFEVTLGAGTHILGLATAADLLTAFPGNTAASIGYYPSTGSIFKGGSNTASGTVITSVTGDVIGVALDLIANTVRFYKNGVAIASAASAIPAGTLYAALSLREAGAVSTLTINFGATAFAFAPPAGFSAWG